MQITAQKKSVRKNVELGSIKGKTAIGRAALGLSIIAVFSKAFGFAEKLIVAHFFGTDTQADVYFASMGIVLSLVFLVKELIYPSVLPVERCALRHSESIAQPLQSIAASPPKIVPARKPRPSLDFLLIRRQVT